MSEMVTVTLPTITFESVRIDGGEVTIIATCRIEDQDPQQFCAFLEHIQGEEVVCMAVTYESREVPDGQS